MGHLGCPLAAANDHATAIDHTWKKGALPKAETGCSNLGQAPKGLDSYGADPKGWAGRESLGASWALGLVELGAFSLGKVSQKGNFRV